MTSSHLTDFFVPAAAIAERYRYDWQLFADWCVAVDLSGMPADPITVAVYLDEHPAAPSTQRRRIAAINSVHTRCGHPAPGSAHALRERLTRRKQPRPDLRDTADEVIRRLPTSGWPGGLFGRRDALLLTLACHVGLTPTPIGRLRRSDITFDGHAIHLRSHGISIAHDADASPRIDPVAIYLRWARLQAFIDRNPSNRWLAASLTDASPVTDDTVTGLQLLPAIRTNGPLLPSFDKWGHANLARYGLSRRATTRILTTHLSGATPIRAPREVRFYDDGWTDAVEEVVEAIADTDGTATDGDAAEAVSPPELTSEEIAARYEAGLAARRGTAEAMADLQPSFDDLDDRTDELLARIQSLLDSVEQG